MENLMMMGMRVDAINGVAVAWSYGRYYHIDDIRVYLLEFDFGILIFDADG
jgi:hypothetical protein